LQRSFFISTFVSRNAAMFASGRGNFQTAMDIVRRTSLLEAHKLYLCDPSPAVVDCLCGPSVPWSSGVFALDSGVDFFLAG
jgi:hypothetical protein